VLIFHHLYPVQRALAFFDNPSAFVTGDVYWRKEMWGRALEEKGEIWKPREEIASEATAKMKTFIGVPYIRNLETDIISRANIQNFQTNTSYRLRLAYFKGMT
jgi:hypothetical protein